MELVIRLPLDSRLYVYVPRQGKAKSQVPPQIGAWIDIFFTEASPIFLSWNPPFASLRSDLAEGIYALCASFLPQGKRGGSPRRPHEDLLLLWGKHKIGLNRSSKGLVLCLVETYKMWKDKNVLPEMNGRNRRGWSLLHTLDFRRWSGCRPLLFFQVKVSGDGCNNGQLPIICLVIYRFSFSGFQLLAGRRYNN